MIMQNCHKSKSESEIVLTRRGSQLFFLAREFHSLSLLLESKVSLKQPVSVLHFFIYTLKCWRCSYLKFETCGLIILCFKNKLSSSKTFKLLNLLISLFFTLHFFCILYTSTSVSISSRMWYTSQHPRSSKYALKFEWIDKLASKRLCRSSFCERDLVCNMSNTSHVKQVQWLVMYV